MNKTSLIESRNLLLIQLLWLFYIIDTAFYTLVDQRYDLLWPPVGLGFCLLLTGLNYFKPKPHFMMIVILASIYSYLFYLNLQLPYLVNYIFLVFGIILSAFYQSYLALGISTSLAAVSLITLNMANGQIIAEMSGPEDLPYILLFAILTSILLFFMIKHANRLWEKAERNEMDARKDLESTRSYIDAFFDNTSDSIVIADAEKRILRMNGSFFLLFHSAAPELGDSLEAIIADENGEISAMLDSALLGRSISGAELSFPGVSDEPIVLEATVSPVYSSQHKIFAVSMVIRDVTEKKKLEEYLRNSEKLKVTGEMAASVAHEIKNPLTVISGFIQMIGEKDNDYGQYISIIHSELERMNGIINEFLYLSKPHTPIMKPQPLEPLLSEAALLFETEAHYRNVRVVKDIPPGCGTVLCDPGKLKQACINLVQNSIDAMQEGGVVKISCRQTSSGEASILIEDSGCGMPDELLQNIKKPFFTTKESGTGLGLMITEQIIQQHKGRLSITSMVGAGTTAEIHLPLLTEDLDGSQSE
ncbi:PAS domain S-box protein [Bacillus infantis]|uniref:two-component system sensor histidine kinase NtrB n=1 Tax=Bacillus infantis TaxID=324767 RepID=UPI001CD227FD|nr:ATP-binding protein [Bacillus infantis]MCA1039689.1 PAS domain S-box protein [Bacillus infantis]